MALNKDRSTRIRAQGTARHRTRKLGAVKVYKGGIAARNAAGYLVPASDTAGLVVVGVFEQTVDNSGGDAGDMEASYVTGVEVEYDHGGAIVQGVAIAMASDDHTLTDADTAAHDIPVGTVTSFTASTAFVFIDEDINQAAAAALAAALAADD